MRILCLRSSIFHIFFNVSIDFLIESEFYCITTNSFDCSCLLYTSGTSLLILVGVVLDTLQQVESHLLMRHYDGLLNSGRIKGRAGNVAARAKNIEPGRVIRDIIASIYSAVFLPRCV